MTSSIILYQTPQVKTLVLGGNNGEKLMNFPINRTNFILTKNVTNELLFFIKNVDNKPVSTANGVANMIMTNDTDVLMIKELVEIDPAVGLYKTVFSPSDITSIEPDTYNYSVSFTRTTGEEVLLFTDKHYGFSSILTVRQGPYPKPVVPQEVTTFTNMNYALYSSALDARLAVVNTQSAYTFAITYSGFKGKVDIEASLMDSLNGSDSDDWFTVRTETSEDVKSITESFTEYGNFRWVRFVVSPLDNVTPIEGSVIKITMLC